MITMLSRSRDKRLERAQVRVLFQVPFFAPGVARLGVVWDDSIPTACTDGKEIRWNPDWFDSLKDEVIVTVLCHEVCHLMLGHLWRNPPGADHQTWNIACDHAVNLMLKEFGALRVAGGYADPFPFPDPQDAFCADPRFSGMAEEAIYAQLANGPLGSGSGSQGSGAGIKVPQKGKCGANSVGLKPLPGSMPDFGQFEAAKDGPDPSSSKALRNDWEGTLLQAAQTAKGRGDLPAGMARLIGELVTPKVPWSQVLRSWLREQCADDWTWLEPAMEYEGSGFMLPSLKSDRIGSVLFATDTSGSIGPDLLTQFQSEKQACLDEMRPRALIDVYCDAKVQKVVEYTAGDVIGKDGPGGGGTRAQPVWDYAGQLQPAPKAIVYLTDLAIDFGADPGVPVIWVNFGPAGAAVPFGEVVDVA